MNTRLDSIFSLAFFIFTALVMLVIAIWIFVTERRLQKFFLGKKARDLEDTIVTLEKEIENLTKSKNQTENELKMINAKLRKSIRGLETIRFNPFSDQGSNQSFAISLLNEDGDGVVMSSLYSRERMSVFAKPIKSHSSEFELSTEEKEVLEKAKI